MSEMAAADRGGRRYAEPDLDEFLREAEPMTAGPSSRRLHDLRIRGGLHLILYLLGGILLGALILSQSAVDALTFLALFALWLFLGIPACCKLER